MAGIPVVQNREELEHIFNLMTGCSSYLEIGTAEGNSLFVLANAMPKGSDITYIDLAEPHTAQHRNEILKQLKDYNIVGLHGDSNEYKTKAQLAGKYDAVLIDAGHKYDNVVMDAMLYGHFARKYIFFHDVQLPEVNRAYESFCKQSPGNRNYKVINSFDYGYGIIEQ